jgi:hypothetical protein
MSEANSEEPRKHNDGDHLSDEEVNRALKGYEHEFDEMDAFDEQLEGILGERAKSAVILTPLRSQRLLAAFCALCGIHADCVGGQDGAVALLTQLDGQAPEHAAASLSHLISGFSVILIVNRADKLVAKPWIDGKSGQKVPPPVVLAQEPPFVEDYLIGVEGRKSIHLQQNGILSKGITHDQASQIVLEETKQIRPHHGFHPFEHLKHRHDEKRGKNDRDHNAAGEQHGDSSDPSASD